MTATFHVSIAGDDAHDGSADRPWRTISAAAARTRAGDTILAPGPFPSPLIGAATVWPRPVLSDRESHRP